MGRFFTSLLSMDRQVASIGIAMNIHGFAHSLVTIFIPLIIYQHTSSFTQIAWFYLTYAVVKLCVNYSTMRCIQRWSASYGLALGYLAGATQFVCIELYTQLHSPLLLVVGAVALACTNAFCWNAQHLYFSKTLSAKTMSTDLAHIDIIGRILSTIGPLIGAVIGTQLGSSTLLSLAALLLIITLFPIRAMHSFERTHPQEPVTLRYTLSGAAPRDLFANFFFNIESAVGYMLWPVFLAFILNAYAPIGIISTSGMIVALIVVKLAGSLGDRGKSAQVLREGALGVSSSHLLRLIVTTPLAIGAVAALYQASFSYMFNGWLRSYYVNSAKHGINYIMSMEIACDLAYVFLWSLFLLLYTFTTATFAFDMLFLLAAFAAFGPLLISKEGSRS